MTAEMPRPPAQEGRVHCADFEPLIPADLVVRDPEICGGRPTMKGTRILAENVHRELAGGMSWMEILEWWPSIPVPAAQEGRGVPQTAGPETDRGTGVSKDSRSIAEAPVER